ncbi:MAG TPA: YbjQ family protein [Cyclobacteriaceae bacterium]|nr:YbjQ family protein [Cyclobacteriaceae bacterium]
MDRNLITTSTELPGYKIVSNLGVVRGITVRSRNVFMNIGASIQTLVGGNISIYSELCEKARAEAFDLLVQHADEKGADALIAIRYDANEIMAGVTEVLVYGTAVKVERI